MGRRAERSDGTRTRTNTASGEFPPFLCALFPPAPIPSCLHPSFLRHEWRSALLLVSPHAPIVLPNFALALLALLSPLSPSFPSSPTPSHLLTVPSLVACPLAVALVSPLSWRPLAPVAYAPPLLSFALSSLALHPTLLLSSLSFSPALSLLTQTFYLCAAHRLQRHRRPILGDAARTASRARRRARPRWSTFVAGGMAAARIYGQGEIAGAEGKQQRMHQGHGQGSSGGFVSFRGGLGLELADPDLETNTKQRTMACRTRVCNAIGLIIRKRADLRGPK